ncbi:hypothetical protein EVAR_60980_1 [Eumeta japonica]|uniref:Uncharacterized protein n=1 Tax=Eumeta variegata TaxID=151549 RepID=A0A4C1XV38_EUMVA|nr:hypothetical protein EVAR_60980_1 [Eumeta japonica]
MTDEYNIRNEDTFGTLHGTGISNREGTGLMEEGEWVLDPNCPRTLAILEEPPVRCKYHSRNKISNREGIGLMEEGEWRDWDDGGRRVGIRSQLPKDTRNLRGATSALPIPFEGIGYLIGDRDDGGRGVGIRSQLPRDTRNLTGAASALPISFERIGYLIERPG